MRRIVVGVLWLLGSNCPGAAVDGRMQHLLDLEDRMRTADSQVAGWVTCPQCASGHRTTPDVLIPFYERDLCKFGFTARSLSAHDPHQLLGTIVLAWVSVQSPSAFQDRIDEVVGPLSETHDVRFMDFSEQVNASGLSGWFAQQVIKLKIASQLTSDYYIVMDSKNTLIRDVQEGTFFTPCNQAVIDGTYRFDDIPKPHSDWYKASAKALNMTPPATGYWPTSITPMVMHRQTVLHMLDAMHEWTDISTLCSDGPLCELLGAHSKTGQGSTEFTMYVLFARASQEFECVHKVVESDREDFSTRKAVSLWRGVKPTIQEEMEKNMRRCETIVAGKVPLMFGAQQGALNDMARGQKAKAVEMVAHIFTDAKLFDPATSNVDALIDCVVGGNNEPWSALPPLPPAPLWSWTAAELVGDDKDVAAGEGSSDDREGGGVDIITAEGDDGDSGDGEPEETQAQTQESTTTATTTTTSTRRLVTLPASTTSSHTISLTPSPTASPSAAPTSVPSAAPTLAPSVAPTEEPTARPTAAPTDGPTSSPSAAPSAAPTDAPTVAPTSSPSAVPTRTPTPRPTAAPTPAPTHTDRPTASPTLAPTREPTAAPTAEPSSQPSPAPTKPPTTTAPPVSCDLIGCIKYSPLLWCQCDQDCVNREDCCDDAVDECHLTPLAKEDDQSSAAGGVAAALRGSNSEDRSAEGSCESSGCVEFDADLACQCDVSCARRRDCCVDAREKCDVHLEVRDDVVDFGGFHASGTSCAEQGCAAYSPLNFCQCDERCASRGDCCKDAVESCEVDLGDVVKGPGIAIPDDDGPKDDAGKSPQWPALGDAVVDDQEIVDSRDGQACLRHGCPVFLPRRGCQCDFFCLKRGDCCSDAWRHCGPLYEGRDVQEQYMLKHTDLGESVAKDLPAPGRAHIVGTTALGILATCAVVLVLLVVASRRQTSGVRLSNYASLGNTCVIHQSIQLVAEIAVEHGREAQGANDENSFEW